MAGIDTRIIIVGLPTVARELGADVESIIWVSPSYLLITTGIPYSVFSSLLRSMNPAALGQLPEQEFISGFKVAALVFAIINTWRNGVTRSS
jgi:hypothetical protein